jgi:hypothetical protein
LRGALKITFQDGSAEYYEVNPVGENRTDFVADLKRFLESPHVTLITDSEVLVIPSTSIRSLSITRVGELPEEELGALPGVMVGVKRVVG